MQAANNPQDRRVVSSLFIIRAVFFLFFSALLLPCVPSYAHSTLSPQQIRPIHPQSARSNTSKPRSVTQRASLVLEEAYQLAVTATPALKVDSLIMIGDTMKTMDKGRAARVFRTAFEATQDLPLDETQINRAASQSRIAVGMADVDPNAAIELAMRVEQPPPAPAGSFEAITKPDSRDFRTRTIQQVALKLADNDLPRAMNLILSTAHERNFPYEGFLPFLSKISKTAPGEAKSLYGELVQQFASETPTPAQITSFARLIRAFAELDRPLSIQALDVVMAKLAMMGKGYEDKSKSGASLTHSPPAGIVPRPTVIAKILLIPILKEFEPDRAGEVEKEVQAALRDLDARTNGLASKMLLNPQFNPVQDVNKQELAVMGNVDPNTFPMAQRSAMSASLAIGLANSNPVKSLDLVKQITDYKQKAIILAAIAASTNIHDGDHAKSILAEAMVAAEKIKDDQDRAYAFTVVAESASKIDTDETKRLYDISFDAYDSVFARLDQSQSSTSETETNRRRKEQVSLRYIQSVASYGRIDFNGAHDKIKRLQDDNLKLMGLVQLARTAVLPDMPISAAEFMK